MKVPHITDSTFYQQLVRVYTLRPRHNGRHFADDIFKCIFFKQNIWILMKISLKFVPKGPINKIPALFQIMAWRCPGDKPLPEAKLVSLLTHICITRPQWFNKDSLKAVHYWPFVRESTSYWWIASERASNVEGHLGIPLTKGQLCRNVSTA